MLAGILASMLGCLVTGLAWHSGSAAFAAEPMPRPDDSTVADGVYTNRYFGLSYRLPAGWKQDLAGAPPSASGYYVLASLVPGGEFTGTILVAAQDAFFAGEPLDDLPAAAQAFARSIAKVDGMTVDQAPSRVVLGRRQFARVDFSGVGLYRSTFFTLDRCHLVSFNLTANSAMRLVDLAATLDRLADAHDGERADPVCMRDHAVAGNLVVRVDPPASAPAYMPIPVRLVVGADGAVKDVHVIRATDAQRRNIEAALGQWKFKPGVIDGRAAEIETGVLLQFNATGAVTYLAGTGR
jgi:hypothetical protein